MVVLVVIGLPINNKTSDNFLHGLSDEFVAKCFYFSAKKEQSVPGRQHSF